MMFSDLAHIILLTAIDTALLLFIKRRMAIKKSLTEVNIVYSLIRTNVRENKQRYLKKKQKNRSKDRISMVIMLNGINFIFFRLPLALSSFYGLLFKYNRETMKHEPNLISYIICKQSGLCSSLQEIFSCFYLISFLIQLFIFYKLDTNFKLRILSLKNKLFKKGHTNSLQEQAN